MDTGHVVCRDRLGQRESCGRAGRCGRACRDERRVDHTRGRGAGMSRLDDTRPARRRRRWRRHRNAAWGAGGCVSRARVAVFAVNPKQLDRFRDRHTVAGAKDDRRDAWVLADSLRTDPAAFQPVHQEDPDRRAAPRTLACGGRSGRGFRPAGEPAAESGASARTRGCSRCAPVPMNRGSGRCCSSRRRPRRNVV